MLPPGASEALYQLLINLTSANNDIRSQAEASLNSDWINGDAERKSLLLVGLAEQSVRGDSGVSIQ
jgi:importin-5